MINEGLNLLSNWEVFLYTFITRLWVLIQRDNCWITA